MVSKSFMDRSGRGKSEGVSRFSGKIVFPHSAEKSLRGTLYCLTTFRYRIFLCLTGLCDVFLSSFFCLTVPKNFVRNHVVLYSRKSPVTKKFLNEMGGEYLDFPSKVFCLTVPRNFVAASLSVSKIPVIEKC